MKKLLIIAAAILLTVAAKAQTFGGITLLSGTNYSPIQLHFTTLTNLALQQIQAQTLIVTNINTNESITVSYGSQISGGSISNGVLLTTITTNFPASAGWTNGATWMLNIPIYTVNVPVSPYGYLAISNGQFPSGTCTNGVGLQ